MQTSTQQNVQNLPLTKKEKNMLQALKKIQKRQKLRTYEQKKKIISMAKHRRFDGLVKASTDDNFFAEKVSEEKLLSSVNVFFQ